MELATSATCSPVPQWIKPTSSSRAELAGLQLDQVDSESSRVEVRQGKGFNR
jgi:hypothetical protein